MRLLAAMDQDRFDRDHAIEFSSLAAVVLYFLDMAPGQGASSPLSCGLTRGGLIGFAVTTPVVVA